VFQKLVRFRRTRAAITIDLVALAAALVLLKFVVANSIYGGVFLELFHLSAHGHPAEQIQSMKFN